MRLLVIRTSAMGDVTLTIPVLTGMTEQYPHVEILLLTRNIFEPIFNSVGKIQFLFPDLSGRHKGFIGLIRLYRDIIKTGRPDHVIDLHDVLRSKILRTFFRITGIPVSVIEKGRNEKRSLIKGVKKVQLKHTVERYRDTFIKAGYSPGLTSGPFINPSPDQVNDAVKKAGLTDGLNIGIAPYAKHHLKVWPEEYMISLLRLISEKHPVRYWLFGGKEEADKLASLEKNVQGAVSVAGKFTLSEELALIGRLDLMLTMDSANMHLATMTGIKVVSVWGATDPLSGFGAWEQPEAYSIRIPVEELSCRPCTIYGRGECGRKDFACMKWLTPEIVFEKITSLGIL